MFGLLRPIKEITKHLLLAMVFVTCRFGYRLQSGTWRRSSISQSWDNGWRRNQPGSAGTLLLLWRRSHAF